jgi:hypothetical protein
MDPSKLDLVINIIREEMTATGGNLAGLPPDEPPVDKKKKKRIYSWEKTLEPIG